MIKNTNLSAKLTNMAVSDPVLEFKKVTFIGHHFYDSSISQISFNIHPGNLLLILLEKEHVHLPLADLASGILTPDKGLVRYCTTSWNRWPYRTAAKHRGDIGRLYEGNPWVDALSVSQGIMLGQMHHTEQSHKTISQQATELCRAFGLPGLPVQRPVNFKGKDLARAACARAFMGKPKLMILERPTIGIYPEILPSLLNMLRIARNKGTAVLWLTDNTEIWNNPGVRPTLRGQMYGARLHLKE